MDKRNHKAFVVCSDKTWREFKAQRVERGQTVQDYLGELVEREVTRVKREATRTARRAEARRREVKREAREILGG